MSPTNNNNTNNDSPDLVKELFEYFDKDKNGFLSFVEVATLQQVTSGVKMTTDQYALACKTLECHPKMGLSLKALRWTYAAEGSNVGELTVMQKSIFVGRISKHVLTRLCVARFPILITEEDYEKVFGKPPPKKQSKKDRIYEVTEEGFDVSPS